MIRYKELPDLSIKEIEMELNFYIWVKEKAFGDVDISEVNRWIKRLWKEVYDRGYTHEKKIILKKKYEKETIDE